MNERKKYIDSFLIVDNPQLNKIINEQSSWKNIPPTIGKDAGKIIGLLIRTMNAKRVLEFGTCLGYSTVVIGEALRFTGGKLISIEYDKGYYEATKRNVHEAGLDDFVELILGDANEVIDSLSGPFDLILQDSDKTLYPPMLEKCINLTRKKGLIIADDALFKPMGVFEKFSKPVHQYVEMVFNDKRLYSTLLDIGDGLLISTKLI